MFYYTCKAITVTSGFLYPVYASFKAIKANDTTKLETWLMYWAIIGCVYIAESTVEWIVHWLPFYYEVKTLLLLWLVLPQIQGSSYVYLTYLHPFLTSREDDIDNLIGKARTSARAAGSEWLKVLWRKLKEIALSDDNVLAQIPNEGAGSTQPRPAQNQNASSPLDWLTPNPAFMRNMMQGAIATLAPMATDSAPTPISTQRQQHQPEILRPVESAPTSTLPDTAGQFVSSRSVSHTEVRQRHSEIERNLSHLDPSQSMSEFDMVRSDEAPLKVTGLWSASHPAHETLATPQRSGWFWNRPGSAVSASSVASSRGKTE